MFDVMVVDDDDLVRDTIVDVLEFASLTVRDVGCPDRALFPPGAFGPFGVLVTDIDLGAALDGFAVAREMRRRQPGLPVVYVSGRPDAFRGRVLCDDERALAKPFAAAELVRAVHDLLPVRH